MATKKEQIIEIRPIEIQKTTIRIIGDTPLIVHAWSAKAKREILYKEVFGKSLNIKEAKNPIADFASSMYWLDPMPEEFTADTIGAVLANARFGFPLTAIKQAAISAAYRMGWSKDKMSLRGAFFIEPEFTHYYGGDMMINWDRKTIDIIPNAKRKEQLVQIHTSEPPVMREDMVRVGMGSADIRYRGEFSDWYMDLNLEFNANGQYSLDQIVNIINAGGSTCGIGEWRPERDGQYGMFHVATT